MKEQTNNPSQCSSVRPASPLSRTGRDSTTASVGVDPLRKPSADGSLRATAPAIFSEFVHYYSDLLDKAVGQRVHQGKSLAAKLNDLSVRLGSLEAGASDVIDLHIQALGSKLASVPPALIQVYVEEGRLMVLELMGRLLSYYRTAYCTIARSPSGQGGSDLAPAVTHLGNEE